MPRVHLGSAAGAAIASALLFGASTPLAKLLLGSGTSPQMLAALFYLGSGVGLSFLFLLNRTRTRDAEARLRRADLPRLTAALGIGGVLAPVLLMMGLARTPASSAALLLNLESVSTLLLAWWLLRENVDRRLLLGAAAIVCGAVTLSWGGQGLVPGVGSLYIAAACVAWGIDNTVTRSLAHIDPVQLALIKGLAAGSVNLGLALSAGAGLPHWPVALAAAAVGFGGYGISLVLFVTAMRQLGSARTSAYFSTAPFIGAILGLAVFHDPFTVQLVVAGILMALGVYLHLSEVHEHEHLHEALEHEHRHVHDAHHIHTHAGSGDAPHSHWHRHEPMRHAHRHTPDLHHRHGH